MIFEKTMTIGEIAFSILKFSDFPACRIYCAHGNGNVFYFRTERPSIAAYRATDVVSWETDVWTTYPPPS